MAHGERVQPLQCQIVIIAMLMVISGMDPHMITRTRVGFSEDFGWVVSKWALLGCGSVRVRLCDAIKIIIFEEMNLLPYY
jgi:hypothetical protein